MCLQWLDGLDLQGKTVIDFIGFHGFWLILRQIQFKAFGDAVTLGVITTGLNGLRNVMLDPGLAFGTGTHPTTAMCLQWLDGLDLQGKTVIGWLLADPAANTVQGVRRRRYAGRYHDWPEWPADR
jgi:hypothetical protein